MAANGSKGAAETAQRRLKIPLSLKFSIITVAVVALLLGIAVALALWSSYRDAETNALAVQQQRADALASRIDGTMANLEAQLAWTAQPDWTAAGVERQRADFARMLRQFPAITELFYIDRQGLEQLKVSRLAPDSVASGISHASEPRFAETVKARSWFGPVYVRNGSDLAGTVGLAHADGGVTVAELDLAFLTDLARAAASGGPAFVIDRSGRLIGHPARNPAAGDTDLSALPQVAAAIAAAGVGTSTDAVLEGSDVSAFAAFAPVARLGWIAVAEQPAGEALAPFYTLLWQTALLFVLGLVVAAAAGISLARRVTLPIGRLREGTERLGEGDLSQRVSIANRDELGLFASAFNTMASRLQQSQRGLEAKADERAHGLDVALQQQTLSAGVMKAIGRSGQSLDSVLEQLVASAVQLCDASHGAIWLKRGDTLTLAAQAGYTDEWLGPAREAALDIAPDAETPIGLAAWLGQAVTVDDIPGDQRFTAGKAPGYAGDRGGLAVPLKREGDAEGVIWLSHQEAAPFSDGQAGLVQGFADQALIAIENARLVGNVGDRDRRLATLREEQAALAEVVRLAARTPANARPVLDGVVDAAVRLTGATAAYVVVQEAGALKLGAESGLPADAVARLAALPPESLGARAYASGSTVALVAGGEDAGALVLADAKSGVAVPLAGADAPVGALAIERPQGEPLDERHLDMLTALAAEAGAALATAQLSADLDLRNAEFAASLNRQDASDVLAASIAAEDFDLGEVAGAIGRRIATLCRADEAMLLRRRGDAYLSLAGDLQFMPGRDSIAGRVAQSGRPVQILDAWDDLDYGAKDASARSLLGIPLIAGGDMVGVAALARPRVEPFSDDEVAIASALAELAAVAMEKANFLERAAARDAAIAKARLEKAAAAETMALVGRRSLDPETVLEVLAAKAAEAGGARRVFVLAETSEGMRVTAGYGISHRHRDEDYRLPEWMTGIAEEAGATGAPVERAALDGDDGEAHGPLLAAPMQRDGATLGAFILERDDGLTFDAGQAELAQMLADQAAIALANVRLREELDRTALQRDASLARNTAGAAVQAERGGPADAQAVLEAVAEAAALSGADAIVLYRSEGGALRPAAMRGDVDGELHAALAARISAAGETQTYTAPDAELAQSGFATAVSIPLVADGAPSGALLLLRRATVAFDPQQLEFAGMLAGQAAVAIENELLFRERADRTAELDAALQRSRANAEIAEALNRPALKLDGLLTHMAAAAGRLADADTAAIYLLDGDVYRLAAETGMPAEIRAFEADNPHPASAESWIGRAALAKSPLAVADVAAEADGPAARPGDGGAMLAAPLLRNGKAVGVFALTRGLPGSFSGEQVELVRTYCDLAVVAMDTIGLAGTVSALDAELAGARQERQATADTMRVIGGSAFDLASLLQTLIASAARLSGARTARIYLRDGKNYPLAAGTGLTPDQRGFENANAPQAGDGGWVSRAIEGRAVVTIADAVAEGSGEPSRYGAAGAALLVPLLRQDEVLGVLALARDTPGGFDERHVLLARALADQAVIAIGTTGLIADAQKRSDEIALLAEDLHAARTRLSESERLASLGEFTAGIMHEIRDPLTFIREFAGHSQRIIDDIRTTLEAAVLDIETRSDVEDLADTLADGIKAIADQGRRADSIIRNMLLHARGESGENRMVDINTVVDESLGLAYKGARASRQDFDITLEKALDPKAGAVDLYPQEITRVLLNLIANGFHATEQRRVDENGSGYEPMLSASTRSLGDAVEIVIRDNGTGIAEGVRQRMFDPFFTTKPAGHGTGLGLSLSRDIIVNQHGGTIDVETVPGSFTAFRIVLPRDAATLARQSLGEAAQSS